MTTTLDLADHQANLAGLVFDLEAYEISFPGLDGWKTLQGELLPDPAPAPPSDVLGASVEELHGWAHKMAAYNLATKRGNEYAQALGKLWPLADEGLKARIRENAAGIVDQLRPKFDLAADGLRAAVALGVKPNDTVDTLFRESLEVRDAWLLAQGHADTLDEILVVRQLLSIIAEVEPKMEKRHRPMYELGHAPSRVDWNITVLDPAGGVKLEPYNRDAPWERWLRVAPYLRLNAPGPAED